MIGREKKITPTQTQTPTSKKPEATEMAKTNKGQGRFRSNEGKPDQRPYKEQIRARYAKHLPKVSRETRDSIRSAWVFGTRKQHKAGLKAYLEWVKAEGFDEEDHFPASAEMLQDFAASYLRKKGSRGISAKIYGVRAFHIQNRLPWNTTTQLKYILEGVRREAPADDQKEARRPVTKERLMMLEEGLDETDPKDIAVMAMASVAFFAQLRLGEILPPTEKPGRFDPRKNPVVGNLGEGLSRKGSRTLHLPWTKTKKEKGEDVVICAQRGKINPVAALEYHIQANELGRDSPLAEYREIKGKRKTLTTRAFMARCNEIWKKNGMQRLTGHCFRIGGTTCYLLAGISPDVVKALGRWSSDAFLRYWRSVELLGVIHIEDLDLKDAREEGEEEDEVEDEEEDDEEQ